MKADKSPSSVHKRVRRTYIVDRAFQLKYTLLLVGTGTLISLVFGAMAYLASIDAHRALAVELSRPGVRGISATAEKVISESNTTLLFLTLGVAALMALALALLGILVTHRVAGPLYVMSRYISILAEGRYPVFRPLRRKDELRTFFERFQRAIDSMRARESDEANKLQEAIQNLGPLASNPSARQSIAALTAMFARKRSATEKAERSAPGPAPASPLPAAEA